LPRRCCDRKECGTEKNRQQRQTRQPRSLTSSLYQHHSVLHSIFKLWPTWTLMFPSPRARRLARTRARSGSRSRRCARDGGGDARRSDCGAHRVLTELLCLSGTLWRCGRGVSSFQHVSVCDRSWLTRGIKTSWWTTVRSAVTTLWTCASTVRRTRFRPPATNVRLRGVSATYVWGLGISECDWN